MLTHGHLRKTTEIHRPRTHGPTLVTDSTCCGSSTALRHVVLLGGLRGMPSKSGRCIEASMVTKERYVLAMPNLEDLPIEIVDSPMKNMVIFHSYDIKLVGCWDTLWKIWVRQLGWWTSQYMEKIKVMFQSPPTSNCLGDSNDMEHHQLLNRSTILMRYFQ